MWASWNARLNKTRERQLLQVENKINQSAFLKCRASIFVAESKNPLLEFHH